MNERKTRLAGDVSRLPDYSFGPTTLGWWGVIGFILIEAAAFVVAIGAYYYLLANETQWPPVADPPPLFWGTAFTLVALVSEIPNAWVKKRAEALDLPAVQRGLVWMTALGLVLLALRGFEFAAMNVRWDITAYGSVVWALLVLHTFHTITDVYDTGVLVALSRMHTMDGRKFPDVADNAFYWHFIVASWVVLYVVVYWTPRWL